MNVFALASLSFGMSMDAFAAATAKGATNKTPDLLTAFRGGLLFGVVEAIAPLMGFGLGTVASDVVASFDHWLAFALLAFLAVNIWLACLFIGVATTVMATAGLYLGNRLGQRFGRWAMGLGGVVLMVIGAMILYTHLTA